MKKNNFFIFLILPFVFSFWFENNIFNTILLSYIINVDSFYISKVIIFFFNKIISYQELFHSVYKYFVYNEREILNEFFFFSAPTTQTMYDHCTLFNYNDIS